MSRRACAALAFVPTLAGLITGGGYAARAQTATPTTTAAAGQQQVRQTPPTTANLINSLLNKILPTTTVPAPATTAPPPPASPDTGPEVVGAVTADQGTDRTIPPGAQAQINSVRRSGTNNSVALLDALKPLASQGLTEEEAALLGFGQFPVAGEAYWSDDWWEARFTPAFHLHQGTDIFAARGTPIRAPADGSVSFASEGAGGLAAYLTVPDGTYYYMAHMDRFASDVRSGQTVKQGRVLGFVGTSGNADGGSPHCHFEIHPGGGGAVNPKLTLDRWINDAIKGVPGLLGQYATSLPRPLTAAGMLRRLEVGSLGGPTTRDGPQLWARSVRRENGAVRLTGVASGGSSAPAWDPMAKSAEIQELDFVRASELARGLLAPLTPAILVRATEGGG